MATLLRFTQNQVEAFFAASQDANPLHRDPAYAQRSQFGKPVMYGMAAVLYGLGQWSAGKPFRLSSLRADFRKPLFPDEPYDLQITTLREGHRVRIGKGPIDYALISFTTESWQPDVDTASSLQAAAPSVRLSAATEPQTQARSFRYDVPLGALGQVQSAFGIVPGSLPASQLAAILWASYHVGMEMPGRQALFAELRVEFSSEVNRAPQLNLELAAATFDDRFNRYTLSGRGTGIARFNLAAFNRPQPVDFPLSAIPAFAAEELSLQGKTVFVSGATRGFGASIARICALAGARVAIHYRRDAAAAQAIRDELLGAGKQCEIFNADLEDPRAMAEMGATISASLGHLDLIINSAAPPIRELQFLEQSNDDLLEFTRQNLKITLETARHLLPLLRTGGQFLHVSTQYLSSPVRGFSHYLTAKAAQEGLIGALAQEYRDTEFIVARLPRILTDQTNLPFSFKPASPPWKVALDLLRLVKAPGIDNFRLIDLSRS